MKIRRPTLLVVDDEPEILQSIRDLLRLEYHVITCENGFEAVKVLESVESIHVVMSDQRMPGMTGVEVLRHAKRLRPDATRLILTAYADVKAVVNAINQGSVFRYVAKPWDPDELQSLVRQAVEHHDLIVEKVRLLAELQASNRRLVEANRLKSAFIEVASHELNTPVAVVLGMTQLWKLAQGKNATPAERNWVDRIHSAGKRLASMVERMLKLMRSDELIHPLELKKADMGVFIRAFADEMAPFIQARSQTLTLEFDPELGELEFDSSKISDVLTNLLINAIKFTDDNGQIHIKAHPAGSDRVRVEVVDQGVGIEESARPFVFEPFFTGFDTMHHSSGEFEFGKRGIGLGLCLVKRFVEMHGGTVEFQSAVGSGSTFAFTIPRHPPRTLSL